VERKGLPSSHQLIKEAAQELVETRDHKGAWDLLATLFELPFFELLQIPAPHALLAPRAAAEGREAAARKKRSLQSLPEHLQKELDEAEGILQANARLVEGFKATAKAAAKRKALVIEEAALLDDERSVAAKRQRLEEKRQQINIAIQVSLSAGVPPIRAPPSTLTASTAAQPVISARRRVVEDHYKRAVPTGISPLLADKEAPKGPAAAATNESKSLSETSAKTITTNSLSFLVPAKRKVTRTATAEAPAPPRRTRAERSRIPAPKPSYVTELWKEGRRPPKEPANDDLARDGRELRPVLRRIDIQPADLSEAETVVILQDTTTEGVADEPIAGPSTKAADTSLPGASQTEQVPSDSGTDIEDIIFRVRNSYTPLPKKERKKRVAKKTPKTPTTKSKKTQKSPPPAADNEDLVGDLFGSGSEDEERLLADPGEKPAPLEAAAAQSVEAIDVDVVDLEAPQEDITDV
jgi:hypothetical protein